MDMTQLACERDMAVEEKNKLKNRLIKVEQVKDEVSRVFAQSNQIHCCRLLLLASCTASP